jgi:adenylate cyclase
MVKHDYEVSLDGEERELTVLFSDVRDFTAFSETVTPSQLGGVMNRLLTPLTSAIHQQRGTIDKYMGDAVMAFWGAPLPDEHHAHKALLGAVAMQHALVSINREFVAEGRPALAMGVGVHSGLMNVGNMGSEFRMAYTVMGDNVNLGSRVEGLTKNYGQNILTTEDTVQLAPQWCYRPVDKVRVKGREQPVMLYTPLGLLTAVTDQELELREFTRRTLDLYWSGQFEQALIALGQIKILYPDDGLSEIFVQRCRYFLNSPPDSSWDGVWTHTNK